MEEIKQPNTELKVDSKKKKQILVVSALGAVALLCVVGMILAIIFLD